MYTEYSHSRRNYVTKYVLLHVIPSLHNQIIQPNNLAHYETNHIPCNVQSIVRTTHVNSHNVCEIFSCC